MAITAKELAKKLNISAAAVSMALNNKPGVSSETRLRIIEAATKYDYDFSKIRDKTENKSHWNTIYFLIFKRYGTVVADTPFFSELTHCIHEHCIRLNLDLQIKYVSDFENHKQLIRELSQNNCEGILLLGTEITESELSYYVHSSIPLVVLDTYFHSTNCNYVKINNMLGVHQATTELIRAFGNDIGYLSSSFPIVNYHERYTSFYHTVQEYGFSSKQVICHRLTPSLDGAYSDMCDILSRKEPLAKGYFADNDLIAYGAIKAFKEYGYEIPNDIRIIGFDDIPMCLYSTPTLSTIHVPIRGLAQSAITRLLELINHDCSYNSKIEINTTFIKRTSF